MTNPFSRRGFLQRSAVTAAAVGGWMSLQPRGRVEAAETGTRRNGTFLDGKAVLSQPVLGEGQLEFRIGLARQRTASYPCDSMDFILMDLERPEGRTRHAHWCTGDLSGRLLEFLTCAEGVDGRTDPRLDALFERILHQRRPSGLFGRLASSPAGGVPEDDPFHGANRLFCGLVRHYERTGDARALESARGVAERILACRAAWEDRLRSSGGRFIEAWVTEPFARLFAVTGDQRYLDFCHLIRQHLGTCETACHAHGFLSTLRGLQTAALVTGDFAWNEKPELNRRLIAEKRMEMPDGCTPEAFPGNYRNEGCSIADWLMLHLNAGLLGADDAAYDRAERIFWNALAFNQWIHGGFGHRAFIANGYGTQHFEEAWWCCVHDAGLAMSEYARHAVTFRDGAVRVNLLVPGRFTLALSPDTTVQVTIATRWPAAAEATIHVTGVPAETPVRVRMPACVADGYLTETRSAEGADVVLRGKIGHRIEACQPGAILTYGPLVLAPATFDWSQTRPAVAEAGVPAGYLPQSLPAGAPSFALPSAPDADGFVHFPASPLPDWSYFDEGPGARCWVEGSAVAVPLAFPGGANRTLRFTPLCYNTSNLTLCETPLVFGWEGKR